MSGTERHVRPHPKGGWEVRAPGASRTSGRFDDQAAATQRAREIVARQGGGRVVVIDADGGVVDTVGVEARTRAKDTGGEATDPPETDRAEPAAPEDSAEDHAMDVAEYLRRSATTADDLRDFSEAPLTAEAVYGDEAALTARAAFEEEATRPLPDASAAPLDASAGSPPAPAGADHGLPDGSLAGLAAKTVTDVRELVAAEARLVKAGLRHQLRRAVVTAGAVGATALLDRLGHARRGGRNKLRSSR